LSKADDNGFVLLSQVQNLGLVNPRPQPDHNTRMVIHELIPPEQSCVAVEGVHTVAVRVFSSSERFCPLTGQTSSPFRFKIQVGIH